MGLSLEHPGGWHAGARLRHFGAAPLIEDGSVRSGASTLVNAEIGKRIGNRTRLTISAFNLLDRRVNDIAYFYESRLPGEAAPVQDLHVHPAIPRTLRASLSIQY
jgi:outer membrane receptor protein involved in Fe transport